VALAAARRNGAVHVFAGAVANIPVAIDPSAPRAELPGNPQSMWKGTVVTTFVQRTLAELAASAA
jgi:hypothetical protein